MAKTGTKQIEVTTFVNPADVLAISFSNGPVIGVCFRAWDARDQQFVATFGAVDRKHIAAMIEW